MPKYLSRFICGSLCSIFIIAFVLGFSGRLDEWEMAGTHKWVFQALGYWIATALFALVAVAVWITSKGKSLHLQ